MRRVAITGVGVVSALGVGSRVFWEKLLAGERGIRRISAFDPSGFACQLGGEVPEFKVNDYVPKSYRKATKVMARDIELAVAAADDAFRDAGLQSKAYTERPAIVSERFGCNIGAGLISADLNELTTAMWAARGPDGRFDLRLWGEQGMNQLTPLWLLKYLPNMLACHVTIVHGLKGPSNTITCADASSHLAVGEAYRTIQRGAADLAICGGAECKLVPMGLVRQTLLNRLREDANDRPGEAVRPFDADARGTVLGEGGGLLILEELEHARARGAKVYAEVVGFGASQDTYSVSEPDPSGASYGRAIRKALQEARVRPEEVDLLVPHGLGIAAFDRAELAGLKLAFGEALRRPHFSPIKAQVGNTAAGSGVDVAAAVLGLFFGRSPGAVNTTRPIDPTLNVAPSARPLEAQVAVTSVYSLGGQNAALVLRKV